MLLIESGNLSAEDAENAEYFGLVDSFMETTLPLRPECLDSWKLFSAKDAKDAKCFWDGGFDAGGRYAISV